MNRINRRDFLKVTAAGTAGVILLRPKSLKSFASESTNQSEVALLIDVSKCVGCWWCVMACKDCNGLPQVEAPDPKNPPELSDCTWSTMCTSNDSGVWKFRRQACMHCTDAACVKVCPTGAVSHHEMGFVQYDKDKCSGCGYCVESCPFGIPQVNGNKLTGIRQMNKCIFCIDRVSQGQQTACAEACPTGATKFGKRSELLEEAQKRVAELRKTKPNANLYGDNEMGGLHVMYVLDESPENYDLITDPQLPATAIVHDVTQWLGVGALAAIAGGFGLNYLVARARIARENKEKGND